MHTEVMNKGFVKIGGDKLRVEAPVKERDEVRLEDFTLTNPKTGAKRAAQRYVVTKRGKKLRLRPGNADEMEPNVWHFYKWERRPEKQSDGTTVDKDRFWIVKDSFKGSRDEAVASCIKQFGEET